MDIGGYDHALQPDSDGLICIRKEMSITKREFVRLLAAGLRSMTFSVKGNRIEAVGASGSVTILLSGDRERRIGSLNLHVIDVKLVLKDFSIDQAKRFLQQFDRAYQRGGG